jgi:site-specific recombinase XerD
VDVGRIAEQVAVSFHDGWAVVVARDMLAMARDPLEPIRRLLLESISSPLTRAAYVQALDEFSRWRTANGNPPFTRAAVQSWRSALEQEGYAPSTVNQKLAAVRKLAREAAANGILAAETAAGIKQVRGAKQSGLRSGNWLTRMQAQALLHAPAAETLKGLRDRAALALLVGCGLRRSEAVALTFEDIQQRDSRWVIVDLRGKHGRIRTVPVPVWVKQAVDAWGAAAKISTGRVLRSMNRHGRITGDSMSPQAVLDLTAGYGLAVEVKLRPHDLRRSCAKLCRAAGGELEQIQLLLGHASIQTTERYLGTRQDLANAPNDRLGLKWREE